MYEQTNGSVNFGCRNFCFLVFSDFYFVFVDSIFPPTRNLYLSILCIRFGDSVVAPVDVVSLVSADCVGGVEV